MRGSGINKVGTKEVVKNPTRVVPDLPGFHQLTKLETIRDTRDIDKRSNLMVRLPSPPYFIAKGASWRFCKDPARVIALINTKLTFLFTSLYSYRI